MTTRSRLARLETQISSGLALACSSPETMRRAEIARKRIPDCTDPDEALNLIRGLPGEIYSTLLRLVPDDLLTQMHDLALIKDCEQGRICGPCQATSYWNCTGPPCGTENPPFSGGRDGDLPDERLPAHALCSPYAGVTSLLLPVLRGIRCRGGCHLVGRE
jgi:hypothetical protein